MFSLIASSQSIALMLSGRLISTKYSITHSNYLIKKSAKKKVYFINIKPTITNIPLYNFSLFFFCHTFIFNASIQSEVWFNNMFWSLFQKGTWSVTFLFLNPWVGSTWLLRKYNRARELIPSAHLRYLEASIMQSNIQDFLNCDNAIYYFSVNSASVVSCGIQE